MLNGYDIAYGLGVTLTAPYWLLAPRARRKVVRALRERMSRDLPVPDASNPVTALIHAVALGEINATKAMVDQLLAVRDDLRIVVTVTTDTGHARGEQLYGKCDRVTLLRFPLDFSSAIQRTLDAFRPSVVVLMELEVWPNLLARCNQRHIPMLLVNGRLTPSSFRNYRWGGPITTKMFRRLERICAQEQTYADRFVALGAPADRVRVTGTMKFDNAQVADRIDGADALADAVGLHPGDEPIWVCGSTGPGEEPTVLDAYRSLLANHPKLRLVIVPRHPERFDEVAKLIESAGFPLVRRSNPKLDISTLKSPVILGDTMGELRKFFSLADVVLVGRTLVDLGPRQHGSDMIEPAALAKPVIVGPFTGNFAEPMNAFRAANAIEEIQDPHQLASVVERLLTNKSDAAAMGRRAQDVVRMNQGATKRHVDLILEQLNGRAT
jgi:3-deoxy-D-manno-octulosonic-acid transferase